MKIFSGPYGETAKLILVLAIGAALWFAGQLVYSWKKAYDQGQGQERAAKVTTGIAQDGAEADEQRLVIDVGLLEARARFNQQLEEDRKHEPETAARAERVVPDSRLRAFRQRRLTRERLGCAGEQCRERPPTEVPAER